MSKDQLKAERMKILELLNKGIINVDDAERLLAALGESDSKTETPFELVNQKKAPFRMLKVYVDSADGDQVRIQLPIEFAKLLKNSKFSGMESLGDMDLDIDTLIQMINAGVIGEIVNVESADGDIVRITVE